MNKLAIIVCGWHYAYKYYEDMASQKIPKNWEVDFFVISHRHPENKNTIEEKQEVRNYSGDSSDNLFLYLDKVNYEMPATKDRIVEIGWEYIEKPNTIGDMNAFNQWSDDYDYTKYDMFLISHDDNLILSDNILVDALEKDIELYKPIPESRYGENGHQFKTEVVKNNLDWYFLDNGYSEYIPKAFGPRGSFSFYKKEVIDLLPNNKFYFDNIKLTREDKDYSPQGMTDIDQWNTGAGNFRDFLYEGLPNLGLVNLTRWFSDQWRVSKYCIEGERGFVHWNNTTSSHYWPAVENLFEG